MKFEQTITIDQQEALAHQALLSDQVTDDTNWIKTYTANFGNGIEADIKVVNEDGSPYVDPVLFEDGCEIGLGEPGDELLGDYEFSVGDDTYVVHVVAA